MITLKTAKSHAPNIAAEELYPDILEIVQEAEGTFEQIDRLCLPSRAAYEAANDVLGSQHRAALALLQAFADYIAAEHAAEQLLTVLRELPGIVKDKHDTKPTEGSAAPVEAAA